MIVQQTGRVPLIIQIQTPYPLKDYMNAKSTNFKNNSLTIPTENGASTSDLLYHPRTPIKRHPTEHYYNISATLSPLPLPPKIDPKVSELPFNPNLEMLYVETPIPKEKSKFMADEEQDGINYAIGGRIIFESQGENDQNNSSSGDSQDESEEEEEENRSEQSVDPEGDSEEDSENQQLQESGNPEVNVESGKLRKSSKSRAIIPLIKDTSNGKKIVCNCKKTKCLKLYCDCFRLNQTCDGCNCVGCHNLDIYYQQRNNAIMTLMDRNPDPFGQKIEADKHLKGCNCKKSNCLKKYCECYQAGLKCGENCKCQQCKNLNFEGHSEGEKGASRNTAKKERRMVEI